MLPVDEVLDRKLREAASSGLTDHFAELLQQHVVPALERCAALLTNDRDEASSIAQEAVARAIGQLSEYECSRPVYPWLRGFVVNLSRQFLDRRRRQAMSIDPVHFDSIAMATGRRQGVLSEILRDEMFTRMWLAIGQLPEGLREALVLHHIEGMEYAEISRLTGVSSEALRARTTRARLLLRSSLGSVVDTWMKQSRSDA